MGSFLRRGVLYIKRGARGGVVMYLQKRLIEFGHSVKMDALYGLGTETAVKRFQRSQSIMIDGIVGPLTFVALMNREIEIVFNRTSKTLFLKLVADSFGIDKIFQCRAISGLPSGHPKLKVLISSGREDLNLSENYMQPKFDDVRDAGPIPDGSYDLDLFPRMPFQKKGGGWGSGGWILDPGFFTNQGYKWGINRGGFFIHHDGNGEGTSGCIGVTDEKDILMLQSILSEYEKKPRISKVRVKVT